MRSEPGIYAVLKATTKGQRIESLYWLLYSLGGSTLPIWLGGYLLLPLFGKHFGWVEYGQHGEFALYSAAMIAPRLRLIARDTEDSVFVRRQLFLFFGWIFLTISVALYSVVIAAGGITANETQINKEMLLHFTLSLFILTILFSFLVTLIDHQRIRPKEIFAVQKAGEKKLEKEFETTAPESSNASTESSVVAEPSHGGPLEEEARRADQESDVLSTEESERLEREFDAGREAQDGPESD